MKIIFFDFSTLEYAGGCEKNFMSLGRWLQRRNHTVGYVTGSSKLNNLYCTIFRQGYHAANLKKEELQSLYQVKSYRQFDLIDLILPTKKRISLVAELNSADFVYARNEIFEAFILRYILRVEPKKIIFGFHTPVHYPVARTLKSRLHNAIYNSRIYLHMISDSNIRALVLTDQDRRLLKGYNPAQKIVVIPNPVNEDEFAQKTYIKGPKFKIYFIGRMTEQKGIDMLAESIELISSTPSFEGCDFYFVGNGVASKYLEALASKYVNCHFLGFSSAVVMHYQAADLTLVPSRWEGFPYSVLEAQSCGIPVIASNIPGCQDIITHNVTGWLIEPNSAKALLAAMQHAYELWSADYSAYSTIGDSARKNIQQNYTQDAINLRIESFLTGETSTVLR